MEPADLAEAVEVYQAAGCAALEAQARARGWHQVRIEFADWDTAEQAAADYLGPQLWQAETAGIISLWWFIRKAPCWRLRCHPGHAATPADMKTFTDRVTGAMLSRGFIVRAPETVYEPETCAFGGQEGMDIAHHLFHADSRNILGYLNRQDPAAPPGRTIGRRELSIILCSLMMRGAGQEWHEQGDIWDRVAAQRPIPPGTSLKRLHDMRPRLRQLMTVDTGPGSKLVKSGGSLAFTSDWTAAFEQAGKALGNMARDGNLSRGLRDILAHHVVFHWNRIGLTSRTQSILSKAAREVILGGNE
jgi:thiopeptide-type bacteriocin biosynthesis protein